jgi:hypothetical protein
VCGFTTWCPESIGDVSGHSVHDIHVEGTTGRERYVIEAILREGRSHREVAAAVVSKAWVTRLMAWSEGSVRQGPMGAPRPERVHEPQG